MNQTRYIYKTVPLSRDDAEARRDMEIACLEARIEALRQDLEDVKAEDLPTTRQIQVELKPGDEGYEDAPYAIDFVSYQGNFTWQNIENSTQSKPE